MLRVDIGRCQGCEGRVREVYIWLVYRKCRVHRGVVTASSAFDCHPAKVKLTVNEAVQTIGQGKATATDASWVSAIDSAYWGPQCRAIRLVHGNGSHPSWSVQPHIATQVNTTRNWSIEGMSSEHTIAKLLAAKRSVLRMLIKRWTPVLSCLIRSQLFESARTLRPCSDFRKLAHRTMVRFMIRTMTEVIEPRQSVRLHFAILGSLDSLGADIFCSLSSSRECSRCNAENEKTTDFGFLIIVSTMLSVRALAFQVNDHWLLAVSTDEVILWKRPFFLPRAKAEFKPKHHMLGKADRQASCTQPPTRSLIPSEPPQRPAPEG